MAPSPPTRPTRHNLPPRSPHNPFIPAPLNPPPQPTFTVGASSSSSRPRTHSGSSSSKSPYPSGYTIDGLMPLPHHVDTAHPYHDTPRGESADDERDGSEERQGNVRQRGSDVRTVSATTTATVASVGRYHPSASSRFGASDSDISDDSSTNPVRPPRLRAMHFRELGAKDAGTGVRGGLQAQVAGGSEEEDRRRILPLRRVMKGSRSVKGKREAGDAGDEVEEGESD